MDNFDLRKYIAEGKLLKEDKKVFDGDKLTPKQIEKLEDLELSKEKKSKFKEAGEEAGFDMRGLKETEEESLLEDDDTRKAYDEASQRLFNMTWDEVRKQDDQSMRQDVHDEVSKDDDEDWD